MYPAALTALGVAGNVYVIGNEIQEMKQDIKHFTKHFTNRQREMELHEILMAESLLRDCGRKK